MKKLCQGMVSDEGKWREYKFLNPTLQKLPGNICMKIIFNPGKDHISQLSDLFATTF